MEEIRREKGTHILVIPYPVQGHINPMLQFSKRLASKNRRLIRITLLATESISNIQDSSSSSSDHISNVHIHNLPDPPKELHEKFGNIDAYLHHLKAAVSHSLPDIIHKNRDETEVVIYDSILTWALDVAREFDLQAAPFFTQSCSNLAIYYHLYQATISIPLLEPAVSLPSLPRFQINDMPSFISVPGSYPDILKTIFDGFPHFHQVKWIFCNTFDMLEEEVVSWAASQWPVKNIGPTIPSMYLDKRLQDDKDYGLSLFKPEAETCRKWLDSKDDKSVVYVAFGSLAALGEDQMEAIARGLKRSNRHFLWVVRETELKKLPSNFMEGTVEKGLVVTWSHQLEVLAHKAVGCFVTHCSWNSTTEALSLGVPMVAIPQWSDQPTNAKFVMDVWRVGLRAKVDQRGLITSEEIELCIREVMEGERGLEIKRNSEKWKQLAKAAVDEGGSSDKNIEDFVADLVCS
ncbi:UDP-glycosyltransferase 74E2 isoform X2 [Morus notabilis]|uniref:UDP-glycosyltransferase 74E2 isoform X2 n=1 Tax=Morus notabilis TaxID=981085 RepID=UPI000CED6B3D|nr:UDP-glycosyltransferase 74E2 isoform X2 [Morus notabilis]